MTYNSAALIYIKTSEVKNCVIPGGSIVCQLPTDNNYKQSYKIYFGKFLKLYLRFYLKERPETDLSLWG